MDKNNKIDYKIQSKNNQDIISFCPIQNEASLPLIKDMAPTKYCNESKTYYIKDMPQYRKLLKIPLDLPAKSFLDKISPVNQDAFMGYQQILVLKAYSPSTMRTYTSEFAQLLILLKNHPVRDLSIEKVKSYMAYCLHTLQLSESTIHSRINAIKFYFETVLQRKDFFISMPRPKKPSKLPKSITQQDVRKLFLAVDNLKHQVILKLVYGMGLRVSEVVNLHVNDIDSTSMKVHVRCAKGKKDRIVNLPFSVLEQLRTYYKVYKPKQYLFEGQAGGQYSVRTVQIVFKTAMLKAGINKDIGIHGLRHSFATHLLEAGTDISYIQKLLGHSNINTTLVYTGIVDANLTKVQSPLDSLMNL
jgi:integrase/recombinase XerD